MVLFGASGHAKVIADILLNQGVKVDFIVDDNPKVNDIFGIPVKQNKNQVSNEKCVISIGNNAIRKKISDNYTFDYQTAIHPKATISEFAKIGEGTVIMANAVINPDVTICTYFTQRIFGRKCGGWGRYAYRYWSIGNSRNKNREMGNCRGRSSHY